MTVTYTSEVVTSRRFSVFVRLLLRWRGSIYKLIWRDLLFYLGFYYVIYLTYRFGMDEATQKKFGYFVEYCNAYHNFIPLSFVLGFYVTLVMDRWWSQYTSIPFPDNIALLLSASILQQNEHGRLVRRTIVRYVILTFAMTMTMMCPRVKKRFPTLDHFVDGGLMTADEKKIFEDLERDYPGYTKYWLPLAWAANVITKARQDGLITTDVSMRNLFEELFIFRTKCGGLLDFDWISIPLVYTQVVTIAVHAFFFMGVFGQQFIDPEKDMYFPLLLILEYFFYMGWLKVAETLINPFGEDDDDFEVNWMIDRHMMVTLLIVDKMHREHPKLVKDQYWDSIVPNHLPYTVASEGCMKEEAVESTKKVNVKMADGDILIEPSRMANRKSRENVDSRQGASWLKRLTNSKMSRRRPVARTNSHKVDIEMESTLLHIPEYSMPQTTPRASDLSEFDKLKKLRQEKRTQKLKKYIQLLRKSEVDSADEEQLISEIINDSHKD